MYFLFRSELNGNSEEVVMSRIFFVVRALDSRNLPRADIGPDEEAPNLPTSPGPRMYTASLSELPILHLA